MDILQQDQRYQYAIDAQGDNTANKVLNMVGQNKHVLELGCGPGAMTRFMYERLNCRITALEIDTDLSKLAEPFCDKLYLADLETFDFAKQFADQRFDVIVAADVLEHLKDPWQCLRQIRPLLQAQGYLVVSIPNVAHNAVIAQLLNGRFPYQAQGLLDSTHLRFFTRRDIEQLLLETGFLPQQWQRNIVPEQASEFATTWLALPETIRTALAHAEDGQTYQYIVKAHPANDPGWVEKLSTDDKQLRENIERLEAELRVTDKTREEYALAFQEAREIIAEKEQKIAEYAQAFEQARNELGQRVEKLDEVNKAFQEARDAIAKLEQERDKLSHHLAHNQQPLSVRLWRRLHKIFNSTS